MDKQKEFIDDYEQDKPKVQSQGWRRYFLDGVHPFDREAVAASVGKTSRVLLAHEANKTMGVGAELAAFLAEELFDSLDAPPVRVAARDSHVDTSLGPR